MIHPNYIFSDAKMNKLLRGLSFETIGVQSTKFFDELTQCVIALRVAVRGSDLTVASLPEGRALIETVRRFTNIGISIDDTGGDYGMLTFGITLPHIRNGHIFTTTYGIDNAADLTGRTLESLLKKHKDGFARGSVDIRKNRVDGLFAEIPFLLYLERGILVGDKFTDRGIAAIILHEIGHAFTACEYMARSIRTNQVLADISNALTNETPDKIESIIVKYAKEQELTKSQKEALLNVQKPEDYVIFAYAISDEKSRQELGHSVYEATSCEQLADQYATRLGAGRDLAIALITFHQFFGEYGVINKKLHIAMDCFSFLLTMTWISVTLFSGLSPMLAIIATVSLGVLMSALQVLGQKQQMYDDYDDYPTRFKRIRSDMVHQLKNSNLNAKQIAMLLGDIDEVDKVMQTALDRNIPDKTYSVWHYANMFFSGVYKKQFNMELLQKQLEALASNNLFIQAAKLKTV